MLMTSRERVRLALNHNEPDKVPCDLDASLVSGIHCKALRNLRLSLGLEDHLVKLREPTLMLGEVEEDLRKELGIDVVGLYPPYEILGYKNTGWKIWELPDGMKVQVAEGFNVTYDEHGAIYAYPKGDTSLSPSMKMPSNGLYFDNIIRQQNIDDHDFVARVDYAEDFKLLSDEDCRYYEKVSKELYEGTDYAIFGNLFPAGLGDFYHVPGPSLDKPKGIRDIEEWMMAHLIHPDYIKECFELQTEIGLKNLEMYRQAVGDRIDIIGMTGTDFGIQHGLMISRECYREFYKPYHKKMNDWVHKHTGWKTFMHSCGSIIDIMDDIIEAGFDIINPVQISADRMEPATLKEKYGDKLVFWGGAVNPQKTMPFGMAEEVYEEAKQNIEIFSKGGGFICGNVHNIQAFTPAENIIALFKAAKAQ